MVFSLVRVQSLVSRRKYDLVRYFICCISIYVRKEKNNKSKWDVSEALLFTGDTALYRYFLEIYDIYFDAAS